MADFTWLVRDGACNTQFRLGNFRPTFPKSKFLELNKSVSTGFCLRYRSVQRRISGPVLRDRKTSRGGSQNGAAIFPEPAFGVNIRVLAARRSSPSRYPRLRKATA
ncbi:Hypothetical predicted protein [Lynx pardinus]|uniref:Uncharacterized protein n=1 Tax=Lynx pardinus TaxID=191816 RepID=A0A485NWP1_LYNPA|nr:Hypothetical predicted protein [Lynx pardinus]